MAGRIFVCVTCDRAANLQAGQSLGSRIAAQLESAAIAHDISIRRVECHNGCPKPGNAALRDLGKCVIRFHRLEEKDVAGLMEAAELYDRSCDGNLSLSQIPAGLRDKVSTIIPPIYAEPR